MLRPQSLYPFNPAERPDRIQAVKNELALHVANESDPHNTRALVPYVYNGTVAPSTGDCKEGDIFINTSTGDTYYLKKTGTPNILTWTLVPRAADQVQADWSESDSDDVSYIKNKPTLAQADWSEDDSDAAGFIKNKPVVSQVDLTGYAKTADLPLYVFKYSDAPSFDTIYAAATAGKAVICLYTDNSSNKSSVYTLSTYRQSGGTSYLYFRMNLSYGSRYFEVSKNSSGATTYGALTDIRYPTVSNGKISSSVVPFNTGSATVQADWSFDGIPVVAKFYGEQDGTYYWYSSESSTHTPGESNSVSYSNGVWSINFDQEDTVTVSGALTDTTVSFTISAIGYSSSISRASATVASSTTSVTGISSKTLNGLLMASSPSQNEMARAVKLMWEKMGGSFA